MAEGGVGDGGDDRVQVGDRKSLASTSSPFVFPLFTSNRRAPTGNHHGQIPAPLPETDHSCSQTFTVYHYGLKTSLFGCNSVTISQILDCS